MIVFFHLKIGGYPIFIEGFEAGLILWFVGYDFYVFTFSPLLLFPHPYRPWFLVQKLFPLGGRLIGGLSCFAMERVEGGHGIRFHFLVSLKIGRASCRARVADEV